MDQHEYYHCQCVAHESFESENERYVRGQRRALEFFFSDVNKDSVILDCACGDGVGLKWFLDNGFGYANGVEMNPRKAKLAKRYSQSVYELDMHDLSSLGSDYDVIWSSHSLEHCHDPIKVLQEFKARLKPGGQFFLVLPYPDTTTVDAHIGNKFLKTNMDHVMAFIDLLKETFAVDEWKLDEFREKEVWVKAHKD